ncbi:hypothetical protein [Paraliomyxa miuraensis]|uniref:hypothetical protein n=1 Tax=Paraliomyxa miuraensis TaxID=376150 RepID=UPI002256B7A7|nr:hypothetical protein [Paraliomyxa miuraensis]MCX4244098.1 hypothetical protein [Paraliomyxa miuraensis]
MFSGATGTFTPDLIVEVTTVCDRACPGCYSPTLRTREDPAVVLAQNPELFLSPQTLEDALQGLGEPVNGLSLRGGEPSRHPLLSALVEVSRRWTYTVWVETHARFLLHDNQYAAGWLETLHRTESIVKISYDRMHRLKAEQLRVVIDALEQSRVRWMIAITEPDHESFARTRAECAWIDDEHVIFQHKVTDHRLLVQPRLGTIDVAGRRRVRPTHRKSLELVSDAAA